MIDTPPGECTLLLLPDGRLMVKNATPEIAALLAALQPENSDLALRAASADKPLTTPTHLSAS